MTTAIHCDCGAPATTEVQNGWDAAANHGIYLPLCEACYQQTDEAAHHRANYARLLAEAAREPAIVL